MSKSVFNYKQVATKLIHSKTILMLLLFRPDMVQKSTIIGQVPPAFKEMFYMFYSKVLCQENRLMIVLFLSINTIILYFD